MLFLIAVGSPTGTKRKKNVEFKKLFARSDIKV